MNEIRKKYRKYWIVIKDPHQDTCLGCDALDTLDCKSLAPTLLDDCFHDRLNGKFRIFKLIKGE